MKQQVLVLSHFQVQTSLMCMQCYWEILCRLSAVCGEAVPALKHFSDALYDWADDEQ